MNNTLKINLLALSLWGLAACTDNIAVNVEGGETQLSIDGEITDQPGPYTVKLTQTVYAFGSDNPPPVLGAVVVISDNLNKTDTLKETSAGTYQTKTLRGKVGNTYTLRIQTTKFGSYTAQTTIRRPTPIDSVYSDKQALVPGQSADSYFVRYDYTDPVGVGDNFRAKLYQNQDAGPDKLLNKPIDLSYVQDIYNDGKSIKNVIAAPESFKKGDRATLVLLSITDDAYQFLRELQTQTNNGGLFANPPANVRTNIINLDTKGKKAVGYFFGSAVVSRTTVVK